MGAGGDLTVDKCLNWILREVGEMSGFPTSLLLLLESNSNTYPLFVEIVCVLCLYGSRVILRGDLTVDKCLNWSGDKWSVFVEIVCVLCLYSGFLESNSNTYPSI